MDFLALVRTASKSEGKQVSQKGGGEFAFPCPFCTSSRDGLHLFLNGDHMWFMCHTCGSQGGEIIFVMKWQGITGTQAVDYLSASGWKQAVEPWKPKPTITPSISDIKITYDIRYVEKDWRLNRDKAFNYFSTWGLTYDDVDKHWLGWIDYHGRGGYQIPHFWSTRTSKILKGVKIRHEDEGHRFSTVNDSLTRGVFNDWVVCNPDGSREGPILNHVFILEAEKDAILMDGLGYPSIAYFPEKAWNNCLWYVLKNVVQPVIIYDNDGGKGLTRANTIAEYMPTRPPMISTADYGVKSPSDLAKERGVEAVNYWMYELGY